MDEPSGESTFQNPESVEVEITEQDDTVLYPLRAYSSSWQRRKSSDRRISYEQHKNIKKDTKFTPFYLRWTYGNTKHIAPINLTSVNRKLIFYASAHAGVLHDYEASEMRLLQGHPNRIKCISADEGGRWVITADSGKDNTLIVWDTQNWYLQIGMQQNTNKDCRDKFNIPIFNLFNPHGNEHSLQLSAISKSSKYIITLGNEQRPIVKIWLWTYGRETADGSITLDEGYGEAKSIKFNPNNPDHFVITFENKVVFLTWTGETVFSHVPELNLKGKGKCNDSCYVLRSHNCITCTSLGRVLIWANTVYTCPFDDAPPDNKKFLVKIIRIENDSINVIRSCDGIVITGDSRGRIQFYDSGMKLLYWFNKELDPILGLSYNPDKRYFKFIDPLIINDEDSDNEECPDGEHPEKNRAKVYEKLYQQNVPTDATLARQPFVMRDIIAFTSKGHIILIKFLENSLQYLTDMSDTWITAIATHDEKNLLIIGNADGKLQSYNIRSNSIVTNYQLIAIPPENPDEIDFSTEISAIQFSPGGFHLACATRAGILWMLDPTTLEPKTARPLIHSRCLIKKIAFSSESTFMAYFDISEKVVIYEWKDDIKDWTLLGKIHSHYKPIHDILFSIDNNSETTYIPKLFTIGEDRRLVQYDLLKSMENDEIVLGLSERVEQSAIPLCFIWSPIKTKDSNFFLVSDNQYKFKLWNDTTAMTHRTVLGPTFGAPVQMMMNFPDIPDNPQNPYGKPYIIFSTDRHIGIQNQPPTGNPYGYVGMLGHPTQLRQIALSYDGKFLFTLGEDDTCVLKWQVNLRALDIMHKIGGVGLEPFYCLIEGGQQGWLFNEVKDLFYYMQILHQGENTAVQREVSTVIPVSEVPDLMRAVGFYPTEYEVENMIIEVKYKNFNSSKEIFSEIEFEDFVKLYINHRPAFGIHLSAIKEAFETFASSYNNDDDPEMSRGEFLDILCYTGECFAPETVKSYLTALLHFTEEITDDGVDEEDMFNFLPEVINNTMFIEDILGIDLNREECSNPIPNEDISPPQSLEATQNTSTASVNDTNNTKNTSNTN